MDRYLLTPYFLDQHRPGLRNLAGPHWTLIDPPLPATDNVLERMAVLHRAIADQVAHALAQGHCPVHMAGDCCTTIGVLAGLRRSGIDPVLVWLDAHGDFNTWETTPSGFLGGMPLAMLVGRGDQTLLQAADLSPIPEERVLLSDARDLDPGEREALAASRVHHIPHIRDLPGAVRQRTGKSPLYLHFDVDVLSPEAVPAVDYPALGGPTPEDLAAVFRDVARTGRVAAVSVSAWNPDLPGAAQSREVCMALLTSLLDAAPEVDCHG